MSEVSDLAFVIDDGTLSEDFIIARQTGSFQIGGWIHTEQQIPGWGVVSVATAEDLEMVLEGDKLTGAMVFHSQQRIYITEEDNGPPPDFKPGTQYISDQMIWNNHRWRVTECFPYPNRNYWKAIAVRMKGH
jgi:hypothetical protein